MFFSKLNYSRPAVSRFEYVLCERTSIGQHESCNNCNKNTHTFDKWNRVFKVQQVRAEKDRIGRVRVDH